MVMVALLSSRERAGLAQEIAERLNPHPRGLPTK